MEILSNQTLTSKQIALIEHHYKAKFVCETSIKTMTNRWTNYPAAIFYTKEPHPKGSNWFAVYHNTEDKIMITNGITATEPFHAITIDGVVMYSRYRHDFFEKNGVFVDGGREYMRCGGQRMDGAKVVKLQIVEDRLELVDENVLA